MHILGGMTAAQIVSYEPYNRGRATVGTGPFRFEEWKAGEYIRVVRNPDYWRGRGRPQVDQIVWAFIPDSNTRWNALRRGQYDWGRLEPTQVGLARGLDGYDVHLVEMNSAVHLDLSLATERGRKLFADPRVRRALFHAIDREAIATKLLEGTVKVADSPLNPKSPFHNPGVRGFEKDLALAKRLLDDAGWSPARTGSERRAGSASPSPFFSARARATGHSWLR